MQIATESAVQPLPSPEHPTPDLEVLPLEGTYADHKVIRRNGAVVGFEPAKIAIALTKAFIAVNGGTGAASARVREQVAQLSSAVVKALVRRQPAGGTFHIEDIQDQVELALMRAGEHNVARAYVLYREDRARERARQRDSQPETAAPAEKPLLVTEGGQTRPLDLPRLTALVESACAGLGGDVSAQPILEAMHRDLYDGVPMDEVRKSLVLAARALIEQDPSYSQVTARLLLHTLRMETLGEEVAQADMATRYARYLPEFVKKGISKASASNSATWWRKSRRWTWGSPGTTRAHRAPPRAPSMNS